VGGKQINAHRFSYVLHYGEIGDGLWVLHKCDNRKCVNPNHLYLGDAARNSRDAVERNRTAKGDRNGSRTHAEKRYKSWIAWRRSQPDLTKGERNGRAKLTVAQVIDIRKLYESGSFSKNEIARLFNVSNVLVGKIVRRELWAHVA